MYTFTQRLLILGIFLLFIGLLSYTQQSQAITTNKDCTSMPNALWFDACKIDDSENNNEE